MEKSKNLHTIQLTDHPGDGNENSSSLEDLRTGTPTGSLTKYNPYKSTGNRGLERTPRVGLAHELFGHGWDADQGIKDYRRTSNGIKMSEVNAVIIENMARESEGDQQRTTYGGKIIPAEILEDARILQKNRSELKKTIHFLKEIKTESWISGKN